MRLEDSIFNNDFLVESFETVVTDMSNLKGAELLPMQSQDESTIKVVREEPVEGITPAVAPDAESPLFGGENITLKTFTPVPYREKRKISGDELIKLTQKQELTKSASQIMSRHMKNLGAKVSLRMENDRWRAMTGSLDVTIANVTTVVDYEFPAAFKPTLAGVSTWTDVNLAAGDATPVQDLITWLRIFKDEASGYVGSNVWMNEKTYQQFLKDAKIQATMVNNSSRATQLDAAASFVSVANDLTFNIYDEGYVDSTGTFVRFIKDNEVFITGKSNMGEGVGEFTTTPHPYTGSDDITLRGNGPFAVAGEFKKDPVSQELIAGVYGLPALYSTKAIVYAKVA